MFAHDDPGRDAGATTLFGRGGVDAHRGLSEGRKPWLKPFSEVLPLRWVRCSMAVSKPWMGRALSIRPTPFRTRVTSRPVRTVSIQAAFRHFSILRFRCLLIRC